MRRLTFVLLSAFAFFPSDTEAASNKELAVSGLRSVSVLVEQMGDGAKAIGLFKEDLQTDVELRLRLAGIKVVTDSSAPFLYVVPHVNPSATAADVGLELCETVTISRSKFIVGASTWEQRFLLANPSATDIRDAVKDLVDQFLNIWLKVNPKTR
jgi:hypothetical protein